MSVRMLCLEGGGFGGGLTSIEERNRVSARTLAPKGVDCENHIGWGGERRGWIVRIPHWLGRRTLGLDCENPTLVGEEDVGAGL